MAHTNKSQIDFSTYSTKWQCYNCKYGYENDYYHRHQPQCTCDPIYLLNRIRILFDEPVSKDTIYEISMEVNKEFVQVDYPEKDQIPVDGSQKFNMLCNMELSADDETTVFEPHCGFLETFFGIKDELVALRTKIGFAKKLSKGKLIPKSEFKDEIDKLVSKFDLNANNLCTYTFFKHKAVHVKSMLISKLAQILLKVRIESLFDDDIKENPHVSRRK